MAVDFQLIDDSENLLRVCEDLRQFSWLAVDTEFERTNTYYAELCLLQLASPDSTVLIDPIRINNLEPVFALLFDESIIKVFHSARQDLEIFYHLKGQVPVPLFDTQLAAPLLGYDESIGYANLVQAMLGVELGKSQTRTNWKQRPLRRKQLEYAAEDVIYLAKIYELMRDKLAGHISEKVLDQQHEALTRDEVYAPDPAGLWIKIRAAKSFSGNNLSVLQQLSTWREETARRENRPRKWILSDRAIIDIARALPEDIDSLSDIKSVDNKTREAYGEMLLSRIKTGIEQPPLAFPERNGYKL
ncbi:MAG: ribonuclease D [Gammaproteobacteria bacterium]|nr:ribonuclease D [Gammaproteobacteria bacterium]NIQ08504.1 ribonuclease D [Gammaproteobacteria bacterium]NIQ74248.1 ribonuclease D [Gammaproteobacteria bacterium]NIR26555.1 ribonuclease D [Gammaproteobacteria bacterium]NIR92234.1 ribonuclease D [Gammaproteobacteria bacterium]